MGDVISYTLIFLNNLLKVMNKYNLFCNTIYTSVKNKWFLLKFKKSIMNTKIDRKFLRQHKYFTFKATTFSEMALTLQKPKQNILQNN